jgi:hypothetical protein
MLFGHLAVSALEHRYLKAELAPVMVAAVFPDAIDKVAHYIVGLGDGGRLLGHTLIAALVTTLFVWAIWGRYSAASWGLGYLSHLVCDAGHIVPWFYPFVSYAFPPSEGFLVTLWASLTNVPRMLLEVGLSIWAVVALWPRIATFMTTMNRARKDRRTPLEG